MADERSMGEKLQSLPKFWLYAVLIVLTSVPLFFTVPIPNKTAPEAQSFYDAVQSIPKGSTVLIASDWTNSTRGESAGEFKALIRILMRKEVKFAFYTTADAQAPQVAKNVITKINTERKLANEAPEYKPWIDYVSVGYFPNAEGAANGIQNDVRGFFGDKKDFDTSGKLTPVFQSPVLANINKVSDFPYLIVVTGSKTSNITIERVKSVPLIMMVTGVMGPESSVYYASGQVKGLVAGLKGVYDIETLMNGQWPDNKNNLDNGAKYLPALHLAILLLIVMVVIGNIGMFMSRKGAK